MNATRPRGNAMPQRGVSLIELLVVLTVLGILATLAIPAWTEHLMRGWRAQARAELAGALLELERHAAVAMSFATQAGGDAVAGDWPRLVPAAGRARHAVSAGPCPATSLDVCVELHAAPLFADPRCGVLILRSTGQWLSRPKAEDSPRQLPAEC
ncbi:MULTISPECIES: prepilin-type N-terminal cleavage/methylation domain-containing protein [Cupriavidus]|uniref:prepilin-type N-terminal cleavage/methylation domain-containing protein n=1 Tax=Cupriavidus sp. DF5525 TaxID=3160989 RepID=UPI0003B03485|nr:hypothetical protein N234_16095 [Ralstonia pickettii DTP0602]